MIRVFIINLKWEGDVIQMSSQNHALKSICIFNFKLNTWYCIYVLNFNTFLMLFSDLYLFISTIIFSTNFSAWDTKNISITYFISLILVYLLLSCYIEKTILFKLFSLVNISSSKSSFGVVNTFFSAFKLNFCWMWNCLLVCFLKWIFGLLWLRKNTITEI